MESLIEIALQSGDGSVQSVLFCSAKYRLPSLPVFGCRKRSVAVEQALQGRPKRLSICSVCGFNSNLDNKWR